MNNNFDNAFIRIPADCLLNMDIVNDVKPIETFDGSSNVEINEMVQSSDIVDEPRVKGHHPYTLVRKLMRR